MKILTVVGARPQFVKAAALSRALATYPDVAEIMVHTGQHFDANMSDIFFAELAIAPPAFHLGIHGGSHGAMVGDMLKALEAVMLATRPDTVVVFGDTNSTLAGALAAAKLGIRLAHVEAGLRSFNRRMPEETNRVVVDHLCDLLFCPTEVAVANLAREGIAAGVHKVGDVMYDATRFVAAAARGGSTALTMLGLKPKAYAVATVHRAENTNDGSALGAVLDFLRGAARAQTVVFPIHPRTREAAARFGLSLDGLTVVAPLGYIDMHRLLRDAVQVFTDSGGLQKEAYFHRVPCVTLRAETEWVETVACGWNRLWTVPLYRPRKDIAEYGDGHAGDHIAALLVQTR